MDKLEQEFLNDLDTKLWRSADKLRSNMDAANYKHVVLGLIFLKYVSDAFEERYEELGKLFKDKGGDNLYYLPPENYSSKEEYEYAFKEELEINDYYKEANIFWVPANSRWQTIREKAVLPSGSTIWQDSKGQDVKLKSVSWLIDNALEEIEKENPKLKGILNRISRFEVRAVSF
jgi:type I restriction enzyme M protein